MAPVAAAPPEPLGAKGALRSLWLGASLATAFFYPLFSAITDSLFYLQWQRANTLELALAFTALAALLGALLHATARLSGERSRALAALAVSAVPLACLFVHVGRQLGLRGSMIALGQRLPGRAGMLALAAAALALAAVPLLAPRKARATLLASLLVLSPISVVSWFNVIRRSGDEVRVAITPRPAGETPGARPSRPSVFVFVFDELDYGYLYDGRDVRSRYPRLRRFAGTADNYHAALAPASETLTSMMGFVLGRQIERSDDRSGSLLHEVRDGRSAPISAGAEDVFARARRRGYRTVLHGWLHPYCELLGQSLDECRSYSVYNYAAASGVFSIANPVFTNVILLPRQQPFGLLKNPVYSRYQRAVVARTYEGALRSLEADAPLFVLVHFSIPHLPFVYDGDRYAPAADPFLQNDENYERQLGYVDHLFGRFLDELARRGRLESSAIALLSDHAYRIMRPRDEGRRVPLLVKRAFQDARADVDAPFATERLLGSLLEAPAGGPATP